MIPSLETLLRRGELASLFKSLSSDFGLELYYVGAPRILDGGFRLIGRLPFPYYRLFLIVLAILLMLLVFYVIFKTSFGLKVRAVRRNRAMSECLGIDTAKVDMMIFVFGSALPASQAPFSLRSNRFHRQWVFRTRSMHSWFWCSVVSAIYGALLWAQAL